MNIGLMLAVLFAVSYQSIHTFSHNHHLKTEHCDHSHGLSFKSVEKTFSQNDDCPICDFKFVAFLAPEVFHFHFKPSFYEIPYAFNRTNSCITTYSGTSVYLRGPPTFIA